MKRVILVIFAVALIAPALTQAESVTDAVGRFRESKQALTNDLRADVSVLREEAMTKVDSLKEQFAQTEDRDEKSEIKEQAREIRKQLKVELTEVRKDYVRSDIFLRYQLLKDVHAIQMRLLGFLDSALSWWAEESNQVSDPELDSFRLRLTELINKTAENGTDYDIDDLEQFTTFVDGVLEKASEMDPDDGPMVFAVGELRGRFLEAKSAYSQTQKDIRLLGQQIKQVMMDRELLRSRAQ